MSGKLRLGVNIDHVATLRNARGGTHPDPVSAALLAQDAGADGITAHLREDRRHIKDADMRRLKQVIALPLNFEMGASEEMISIACEILPNAACLVPERREEVTTEGGLAVAGQSAYLLPKIQKLKDAGIRISLFIEPSETEIRAAADIGADIIELHTGNYANTKDEFRNIELAKIREAADYGKKKQLIVNAGHGLDYSNVSSIARLNSLSELNIGHSIVSRAVTVGIKTAVAEMKTLIER